ECKPASGADHAPARIRQLITSADGGIAPEQTGSRPWTEERGSASERVREVALRPEAERDGYPRAAWVGRLGARRIRYLPHIGSSLRRRMVRSQPAEVQVLISYALSERAHHRQQHQRLIRRERLAGLRSHLVLKRFQRCGFGREVSPYLRRLGGV